MKQSALFLFSLLMVLALVSSCETTCDPVDVDSLNAIYLQFNTDGNSDSFEPSELDSVYFVRYEDQYRDSFVFPVDTFNLYELGFYGDNYEVRLSKEHPLGIPSGPPYYSAYKYRFLSRNHDFEVRLEEINIQGSYVGECVYDAQNKSFRLNEDSINMTNSTNIVQMYKY